MGEEKNLKKILMMNPYCNNYKMNKQMKKKMKAKNGD